MTPQRWEEINNLFNAVVDKDPLEREQMLESLKARDPELCEHVRVLLQQSSGTWRFTAKTEDLDSGIVAPGELLHGRYRLARKIGQGGFGTVYLAHDERLHQKPVVVKLLTRAPQDEWFQKKFRDEIQALARIDHPGVVGILDVGHTSQQMPFMVMQYIEGVTLRSVIAKGAIESKRAASILRQIGQALSAAHAKGVLHRDLKPENIMLQSSAAGDAVRLIDFGIATIREHETDAAPTRVAGSVAYMAPEQLLGAPAVTSDIFAMGIVACEMLTGRMPLRTVHGVRLESLRAIHPPLPEHAIQIVARAVRMDPQQRIQSAAGFGEELAAALERRPGDVVAGQSQSPERPVRKAAYDVFVSHAGRDLPLAKQMVDHLEQKGARCFLAERDTQPGEAPSAASDAAIQSSATVVVVLTDSAANSLEVARELEHADRCSVPVVAVKVDAAEPTERLSRVLTDPHWVESSREPAAVDLEAIERAVRSHVPVLTPRSEDEESRAAEPLLTEFSPKLLPGRPGTRQVTLAAFFTTWALLTCFLSVLGNAGYITVMLQGPQTARPVAVRFGYLYELNAALTYLIVVPCFIYFAVGFVQKAQAAVVKLARRNQLIAKVPPQDNRSAVALVGDANRRWMNKWLLAITCIVTFLVIVGTEYLPPKSDYKHVMFGYVQAPWIADYASVCPNCTLSQLAHATNRELEPLGGLSIDQLKDYRIIPPFYTRSHTAIERIGFGLFIISALGLQVSVTVFVAWAVLKAGFFLKLIYDALIADKRSRVRLSLRYTDPAGMFGLEPVHRALTQLVGLVGVSAVLEILSWWSNALKGSRRALGQDLYTLGGWGQFFVANFSVILAILLLVWLFNVSSITREAAGEEAKRISAGGAATEQDLEMLERQSIWRSPRYSVTYVAAPVVYVMSILMLNRLGIAYAVGDVWIAVLSHVLGRD